MCGGAGRCRDPLTLEIGERFDALVAMHPELRGRDFDIIDQEHLALAARREIRQHGAGREHVQAAADQCLEDFEAGVELAQLKLDAVLVEEALVYSRPDLAVDGNRVKVADTDFGLCLCQRGRGETAKRQAHRCRQKLSSMHGVVFLWLSPEHDPETV